MTNSEQPQLGVAEAANGTSGHNNNDLDDADVELVGIDKKKSLVWRNGSSKAKERIVRANGSSAGSRCKQEPPDGGLRAWSIMLGSFVVNGVLFSIINSYSLVYLELSKRLERTGESEVSSKAALVGSLTIGTTFFLSPLGGILTDKLGIRVTTFLGGALAAVGMYLSSILVDRVAWLYLSYGVMYGLGASLAYTPSLVILGHYFKRRLGLVNGLVTTGSSLFTLLLPQLMEASLRDYGLESTLRDLLSGLASLVMLCALLFKPQPQHHVTSSSAPAANDDGDNDDGATPAERPRSKGMVNVAIWRRRKYVVWASAIPVALFGYFVPYVHIGKFVELTFPEADRKLPVMCIAVTSGLGRILFGYVADLPGVNRVLLQQISFFGIGLLTMLLSVVDSFKLLLLVTLGMGLFDGCFISLLGPIAFDICGQKDAAQAIGFLLGMCSVPLTVGPPVAGLIYDHTHSYQLPFLLAGVPPLLGALAMFLVYRVRDDDDGREDRESGGSPDRDDGELGVAPTDPPGKRPYEGISTSSSKTAKKNHRGGGGGSLVDLLGYLNQNRRTDDVGVSNTKNERSPLLQQRLRQPANTENHHHHHHHQQKRSAVTNCYCSSQS